MLNRLLQDFKEGARSGLHALAGRFLNSSASTVNARLEAAAAQHRAGDLAAARSAYLAILETDSGNVDALQLLGLVAHQQERHDEAVMLITQAIALQPNVAAYHVNCGLAHMARGEAKLAIECYVKAVQLDPLDARAHSILLFALVFGEGFKPADVLAEHRRWQKRHANFPPLPHPNGRDPARRLRIGYVSPDFKNHVIGFFVEPFLAHHDRAAFEIFCYDNADQRDDVTERCKGYAAHWREIDRLDDDAVAAMIRDDRIDVLIDLAGHTRGGRLGVFARKPAPVQMTYLGYPMTSGLDSMDYRVSDRFCDPPGMTEAHYCETLLRLPASLVCYRPPDDMPEVNPLPAIANGYVTFGSFNVPAKICGPVVELWARLLKRVEHSKLLLAPIPPGMARSRIADMFADQGIGPERLQFEPRMATVAYQALRHQVDIALDTFPCGGGSTTCETLYMGVPLVTLAGPTFAARVGTSVLSSLGLPELVAQTFDEYLAIAANLAQERDRLVALRRNLRTSMRQSPLADGPRLARELEALYRDAFAKWCVAPASANHPATLPD
jgi:protein O-GlcNAc transferase